MLAIADKFKSVGQVNNTSASSSSIFGSAGTLAQSINTYAKYRISFYPIIDRTNPEIAMGIASCLCYLLEQYKDVKVYRIFAKIDAESGDSDEEFDVQDSQFGIDDWSFEGLDDNILIFGEISSEDNKNILKLIIDRSMLDIPDDLILSYTFSDLPNLITQLPQICDELIDKLIEKHDKSELIIIYSGSNNNPEQLKECLEDLFYWNLDLYFYLWGVEWDDDEVLDQFSRFLELSKNYQDPFFTWCVAMVASQVMQIGLDAIGDLLVPVIGDIFKDSQYPSILLGSVGNGLLNLGYVEESLKLADTYRSDETTDILTRLTLIEIYLNGNQFSKALDVNQVAIEDGLQDERLYWQYIQLLNVAEQNEWFVEELLLIDPDKYEESEHVTQEIIVALENIIDVSPDNIRAVHTLIPYLIDTGNINALWQYFKQLVVLDDTGRYTQDIVSQLYDIDDLEPGFEIFSTVVNDRPEDPYIYINIAQLAIIDENTVFAEENLEIASKFISSYGIDLEIEIQSMRLLAKFADFEKRLAEISTILSAQRTVTEKDVEFLEEAIEIAPKIGRLYYTLANCYMGWKDTTTALEVLKEGLDKAGTHPQLLLMIAQVYWIQGDKKEAFEYLNLGLEHFPNDALLLLQVARYLTENNQLIDARPYMERAEIIAPRHPALWELKKIIAERVSNR